MRINRNTILNYINNPQLFEDKEKEEIRNELARQGIQQEKDSFEKIANQNYKVAEDYKTRIGKALDYSQQLKDSIDKSKFDGMTKTMLIVGINKIQGALQGSDK